MEINYKIPYEKFKEYFFEYEKNLHLMLKSNKIFLKLKSSSLINLVFISLVIFIASFLIINIIGGLIIFLVFKIFELITGSSIKFEIVNLMNTDISILILITLSLIMVLIINRMLFMAEPPYLLRDLVNDREIIRKNRKNKNPQPIDYTKFLILAMLKNKENIQGPYKYIPGIKKSTTLSDAKKKLNEIKINGIPILNSDYEYIPWKFELVECEKLNKKKKRKIEDMLKTLWEYYLDKEYSRIKRRMIK